MNNPENTTNQIKLIVELGPNSLAKLDQIIDELRAARPNCASCVDSATKYVVAHCMAAADASQETNEKASDEPHTGGDAAPHENTHPVEDPAPWGDPEPVEPHEPAPAPEPEPEPEPEAHTYTKEDVQALVRKLAAPSSPAHKRSGAKEIVKSYGTNVSSIPEDKYPEVMAKLTALDKEG